MASKSPVRTTSVTTPVRPVTRKGPSYTGTHSVPTESTPDAGVRTSSRNASPATAISSPLPSWMIGGSTKRTW